MIRSATAGVVYFALVFGVGFVLGTLRVLFIVPRLGEFMAVIIELPIILTAAWIICDRISARLVVPRRWQTRLAMGAVAFVLLMLAELALSIALFGDTVAKHFAAYAAAPEAVGLAGQALFAAFPLIQIAISRGDRTRT